MGLAERARMRLVTPHAALERAIREVARAVPAWQRTSPESSIKTLAARRFGFGCTHTCKSATRDVCARPSVTWNARMPRPQTNVRTPQHPQADQIVAGDDHARPSRRRPPPGKYHVSLLNRRRACSLSFPEQAGASQLKFRKGEHFPLVFSTP